MFEECVAEDEHITARAQTREVTCRIRRNGDVLTTKQTEKKEKEREGEGAKKKRDTRRVQERNKPEEAS